MSDVKLMLKKKAKALLPDWAKNAGWKMVLGATRIHGAVRGLGIGNGLTHPPYGNSVDNLNTTRRLYGYNLALLPNSYIAELEAQTKDMKDAERLTGLSPGFPAWNLLYYSLMCSLPIVKRPVVIFETGTNRGFSSIIMAQALKDSGYAGKIQTIDIDPKIVDIAKANVAKAGLSDYVEFNVGDSLTVLPRLAKDVPYIDFAFLDGNHEYEFAVKEFEAVHEKVVACKGKVYFDNTAIWGVARAIQFIKHSYGGNVIEFLNCSSYPPGNVIWQPD